MHQPWYWSEFHHSQQGQKLLLPKGDSNTYWVTSQHTYDIVNGVNLSKYHQRRVTLNKIAQATINAKKETAQQKAAKMLAGKKRKQDDISEDPR